MRNTATVCIDPAALRDNLAIARRLCPRSRVMAMVKADAYGHGLLPAARAFAAADGLAVARLQEAVALRDAGVSQRILLLGTLLSADDLAACSNLSIDVTVHDSLSLAAIVAAAGRGRLRVWLKLDSGMHRMGLDPQAFVEANRMLATARGVTELIHMTHFSAADAPSTGALDRQIDCFAACHRANPEVPVSMANSAALISRPDTHGDWVRPGIMLYGGSAHGTLTVPVRPAMRLTTRVLALRRIAEGEAVGYHSRWVASRDSHIATLGIGYGDGYPRHAPDGTPVWIDGVLATVVGRVSMDSIGVDVTDAESIAVGDEVVLWGPELPAGTVADHVGTIDYALFTGITARVTRTLAPAS